MRELTHKEVAARGGRNRAINLKKKLGEDGFKKLMKKVSLARQKKKNVV